MEGEYKLRELVPRMSVRARFLKDLAALTYEKACQTNKHSKRKETVVKSNNQTQMRNSGAFPTRTSENRVRLAKRATQLACLVLVAGFPIGCAYHSHRGSTISTAPAASASDAVRRNVSANYGKLPLSFEAKQGHSRERNDTPWTIKKAPCSNTVTTKPAQNTKLP